jgi:hypothetical protein
VRRAASLLLLGALLPGAALAHALAPSYLELREARDGGVRVRWKTPALVARGARPEPVLPCPDAGPRALVAVEDAWVAEWSIACPQPLVGLEIGVDGLAGSGTDAIARVAFADGREVRAILTAAAPRLRIPKRERASEVLASYLRLGVWHLATGLDHVLFVLGLLLLLGATRRLLVAVTAFTLGHSATLALAAVGAVTLPQAPVELGIAATIVLLARELALRADAGRSPIARRPALLPFGFGLLHGLGFAGALAALGLPGHAIPLALFAFNLGIELGQLALLALALPVLGLARRLARRAPLWLGEVPATAIGSLAALWCIERGLVWLGLVP